MEISIPGTEVSWCQRAFLRKLGHPKLIVISHSIQYTLLDIPSKLHVCFYLVLLGSCFGADRINLKMMKWQVSQATLGFLWDCFFGIHLRTWPPTRQKPFRPMKLILPSFLRTVIFFWAQLKTLVRKKLGCVTDYSFFGRVAGFYCQRWSMLHVLADSERQEVHEFAKGWMWKIPKHRFKMWSFDMKAAFET